MGFLKFIETMEKFWRETSCSMQGSPFSADGISKDAFFSVREIFVGLTLLLKVLLKNVQFFPIFFI